MLTTLERERLASDLIQLRWRLLNEKSVPALLQLFRESADAMLKASTALDVPNPNEVDHLAMIALLMQSVKPTTLQGERAFYVDDSKSFDDAMRTLQRLYRRIQD